MLIADASMHEQVKTSLHELVADHASDLGVELEHVEVALSAGSVVADVTVTVPGGSSRLDVVQRLGTLEPQAAANTVSGLEGISAMMVGDTLHSRVTVDGMEIISTSAVATSTASTGTISVSSTGDAVTVVPPPLAVAGNEATGAAFGEVVGVLLAVFMALGFGCFACCWLRKRLRAKRGGENQPGAGMQDDLGDPASGMQVQPAEPAELVEPSELQAEKTSELELARGAAAAPLDVEAEPEEPALAQPTEELHRRRRLVIKFGDETAERKTSVIAAL